MRNFIIILYAQFAYFIFTGLNKIFRCLSSPIRFKSDRSDQSISTAGAVICMIFFIVQLAGRNKNLNNCQFKNFNIFFLNQAAVYVFVEAHD